MRDQGQCIKASFDSVLRALRVSGGGSNDREYFKHVGATPEMLYIAGLANCTLLGTLVTTVDRLYAIPFVASRGGTLDFIRARVTTGAANSVFRLGIYKATSATNLYPNELVVDGGEESSAGAGVLTSVLNQALEANTLHYLAYLQGVGTPTVRAVPVGSADAFLGSDAMGTGSFSHWTVTQAYAALPATFPAGAIPAGGSFPAVAAHFGA